MAILITTENLGENPVLTSVANELNLTTTWIRSGDGLIGFGEYKKIELTGEDRFEKAKAWWQIQLSEFKIQNNVHGSGTGPILFGSFSFDPNEKSILVIPKIILGKKAGKSWVTWIGNDTQPNFSTISNSLPSGEITWSNGALSESQWKDQVGFAVDSIKASPVRPISNGEGAIPLTKSAEPLANASGVPRSNQ